MSDPLANTLRDRGPAIRTGWLEFDQKVRFVPRILVNVFSCPGVGKSMWALNVAHRVGVPVLYHTVDTPLLTQAIRAWALIGKTDIADVEENPSAALRRADRMRNGAVIEWSDVPMGADEFPNLVEAVKEYLGEPPRIIIVDVIGDLLKERSYEAYTQAFGALKRVAHRYRATVIALHHATKNNDPEEPLFLRDVEYAGDKQPDIVVGMHAPHSSRLVAAILKNRTGESNANGSVNVRFKTNFRRAAMEEM